MGQPVVAALISGQQGGEALLSALLPGRHLVLLDQICLSYRHMKAAGKSLMADRSDGEDVVHQLVDLAEP